MKETPAEKMHNRIVNGSVYSTRGVTAAAFQRVAERAGTTALPDVKYALDILRNLEKTAAVGSSREKHVL